MLFKVTDDELMVKVAQGNETAFRDLYERHRSRVLGYCCRFMGSRSQGEDMTQETWMKVVKAAPQYRGEGKFTSWLLFIARTTCLSDLRGAKTSSEVLVPETSEIQNIEFDQASVEEQLSKAQDVAELKRRIDALPDIQRAVFVRWMSDEVSYEELAREFELSVPAVKSLLFRARQSLTGSDRGPL